MTDRGPIQEGKKFHATDSSVVRGAPVTRCRPEPARRDGQRRRKGDPHGDFRSFGDRRWRNHRVEGHFDGELDSHELSPTARTTGHIRGDERGSTVVEAVLLIPVALVLILFVVQACLWAHAAQVVESAAAQGVQVAVDLGGTPEQGIDSARAFMATDRSIMAPEVSVLSLPGDQVQVEVSATAASIVPWLHLGVTATRRGTVQEFRSDE